MISMLVLRMDLLLEQDGSETSVESTGTLALQHLGETRDETCGVGGLGDETNTGSLERAKSNVGKELGGTSRGKVDQSSVVGGSLVTKEVDGLLLEVFISTKLQGTLEEVSSEGRTGTGQESGSTILGDDLSEATDQTSVVGGRVELDSCLDTAMVHVSKSFSLLSGCQSKRAVPGHCCVGLTDEAIPAQRSFETRRRVFALG